MASRFYIVLLVLLMISFSQSSSHSQTINFGDGSERYNRYVSLTTKSERKCAEWIDGLGKRKCFEWVRTQSVTGATLFFNEADSRNNQVFFQIK